MLTSRHWVFWPRWELPWVSCMMLSRADAPFTFMSRPRMPWPMLELPRMACTMIRRVGAPFMFTLARRWSWAMSRAGEDASTNRRLWADFTMNLMPKGGSGCSWLISFGDTGWKVHSLGYANISSQSVDVYRIVPGMPATGLAQLRGAHHEVFNSGVAVQEKDTTVSA